MEVNDAAAAAAAAVSHSQDSHNRLFWCACGWRVICSHLKKKKNNNNPMLENGRYNTIPSSVSAFVDD